MEKGKAATRIVYVRLPIDHWLFKEDNMSKVVRDALRLYEELQDEIQEIKQSVQEVRDVLNSGQLVVQGMAKEKDQEEQESQNNIDPRLANVLDDFLDF